MSADVVWRKSSRSNGPDASTCVEVADLPERDITPVWVRDSKHPDGGHLALPRSGFTAFARLVKAGMYDL
jgi:hypothetical protein